MQITRLSSGLYVATNHTYVPAPAQPAIVGPTPTLLPTPEPEPEPTPTTPAPEAPQVDGHSRFRPTNPTGARDAAQMLAGFGRYLSVADALVGYGRPEGYESFANARRAAYMLSRGEARPAAGIFEQGTRFYVRAMGVFPADATTGLKLLHVEGNDFARITGVRDPRLAMIVDGSTRIFARPQG